VSLKKVKKSPIRTKIIPLTIKNRQPALCIIPSQTKIDDSGKGTPRDEQKGRNIPEHIGFPSKCRNMDDQMKNHEAVYNDPQDRIPEFQNGPEVIEGEECQRYVNEQKKGILRLLFQSTKEFEHSPFPLPTGVEFMHEQKKDVEGRQDDDRVFHGLVFPLTAFLNRSRVNPMTGITIQT
jgi:hypothetical protein